MSVQSIPPYWTSASMPSSHHVARALVWFDLEANFVPAPPSKVAPSVEDYLAAIRQMGGRTAFMTMRSGHDADAL